MLKKLIFTNILIEDFNVGNLRLETTQGPEERDGKRLQCTNRNTKLEWERSMYSMT